MGRFLYALGRWSFRHRWIVVVTWLVAAIALGGSSAALNKGFNDVFEIPGTPSEAAAASLMKNFPDQPNPLEAAGVTVVFAAPEGHTLSEQPYAGAVESVVQQLDATVPGIIDRQRFGNPLTLDGQLRDKVLEQSVAAGLPEETARKDANNISLISPDGRIAYTSFALDVPAPADVTDEQRATITAAMDTGREQGLQVEAGGAGFGDPLVIKTTSEAIGMAAALLVLLATFGSALAAGIPLVTALLGIGLGTTGILLATHWVPLNNTTPTLAVMLGLAVGIDYALFILSRYRSELRDPQQTREQAAARSVATAGSAVVFAGLTVIIALVALAIVNIPFLSYMGFAAAFTVGAAVLVALTLVPALLSLSGRRLFSRTRSEALRASASSSDLQEDDDVASIAAESPAASSLKKGREQLSTRFFRGWIRVVTKFPAITIALVILGLGALTGPALDLQLSLPNDTLSNRDTTQRKSADLLAEGFGEGINAPFLVVVDAHDVDVDAPVLSGIAQGDRAKAIGAAYAYTVQQLSVNPGVKHVQIVGASADGSAAQMLLTPRTGPSDPKTTALLGALRSQDAAIEAATGVDVGITGLAPIQQDVTTRLYNALPTYLAVVVGLALVLLLIVFRSIAVPVMASVGFLLSVGAAFGATVLVWQKGLWGLVNTPGPLISFMPIFLIGVTFGLAMDYQVFLVTRMREHFERDGDADAAVEEGFITGAPVVTAAALIMIAVFVAFIDQPLPFIKIFGFALGAGVLFDAFFVRMAFIPAAMTLLGPGTWWLPKALDRVLPRVDID
ncbi:MMPL family transporter [Corynebacterium argentoratense]|uniref:MMPL family transporter n=1 Tax=Corynebacterium argentoratense TaxID=42817 RepID=UPI001F19B3E9|nr:MMPL family transporter [Corynebacterium argentoratense]MCF1712196.1 MMPL family transporter [Corynebacterium argentoratense]